jgi:hypothetical protein
LSDKEIGRQFRNPNVLREAEKILRRGKKLRWRIAKIKEICENMNILSGFQLKYYPDALKGKRENKV